MVDRTKQRNKETKRLSIVKVTSNNNLLHFGFNQLRKFHYWSYYNLRSSTLVLFGVTPVHYIFEIPASGADFQNTGLC